MAAITLIDSKYLNRSKSKYYVLAWNHYICCIEKTHGKSFNHYVLLSAL